MIGGALRWFRSVRMIRMVGSSCAHRLTGWLSNRVLKRCELAEPAIALPGGSQQGNGPKRRFQHPASGDDDHVVAVTGIDVGYGIEFGIERQHRVIATMHLGHNL